MLDRITLITGNPGKAAEFAAMLGIEVTTAKAELIEIQAIDPATVAERKAADAYAQLSTPVLVDDTGLSLHGWNGLPGALVVWFIETVGAQGILGMAGDLPDRTATAVTALGYADANGVQVFRGTVTGTLAAEPRGTSGFGFDAIFIPHDSDGRTFAQMTSEEKNKISHRRRAVEAMRTGLGLADPLRQWTEAAWQDPHPVTGARHPKRQPLRGHGLAGLILQEHGHHRRLLARGGIALRHVLGSRALRDDPTEHNGPRRVRRAHQPGSHEERGGHHAEGHETHGPAADPDGAARQDGGYREQERRLDGENHQLSPGHADVAPPAEVARLVLVARPGFRAGG